MLKDACVSKHVFSAAMILKHVLNDALLGSDISLQTEHILFLFNDKEPTMGHICKK